MEDRREFLRKLAAITAFSAMVPDYIYGQVNSENKVALPVIDLHCHPPLKNYLWDKKMWHWHPSHSGSNSVNMQVDMNHLKKGNVKGLVAVHYLPERGLYEQAKTIRSLFPWLRKLLPVFVAKLERGDGGNFRQINTMIDEFEYHIEMANSKNPETPIYIAKNYEQFNSLIQQGKIAVAQSIEGAHALGRDLCCDSRDQYIEHLDHLIDRGVCMMTLAHFFPNEVVYPVEGIPPAMKNDLGLRWTYSPEEDNKPLTATGKRVVERMLERGMIVDLMHSTPAARQDVYEINKKYNRPLVFSHSGVLENFVVNEHNRNYQYMCPTNEEIDIIAATKGTIGIIFMNFWLTGCDAHEQGCERREFKNGLNYVIATIKHIKDRTGSFDYISIGSDFDGLADSPCDLRDPGYFQELVRRLRETPWIQSDDIEKILTKNALRVLQNGWGRRS
ncbi:MAG TPA: membrane dipeptidase [Bacteroidia bacterium]|nr:membrane dipeptidase [Bacteroidia bacterium]